jgi:hypothetical protein
VQRIPWPDADGGDTADSQGSYDSWSVDEFNFPWLDCTDGGLCPIHRNIECSNNGTCLVAVTKIIQPKANIETWITSEGNAYFVQLQGGDGGDRGSSFSGDDPMVGSHHSRPLEIS